MPSWVWALTKEDGPFLPEVGGSAVYIDFVDNEQVGNLSFLDFLKKTLINF